MLNIKTVYFVCLLSLLFCFVCLFMFMLVLLLSCGVFLGGFLFNFLGVLLVFFWGSLYWTEELVYIRQAWAITACSECAL